MTKTAELIWPRLEQHFRHVAVKNERIKQLINKWQHIDITLININYLLSPEGPRNYVQFLGINSALNFGLLNPASKKRFSVKWDNRLWRGSEALSACLMRTFIDQKINLLQANLLEDITLDKCRKIFATDCGEPILLLSERWQILREIGRMLNKYFQGSFLNLLEAANFRVTYPGIIELLTRCFPVGFGSDSVFYQPTGIQIEFQKKARLFAALYHNRASRSHWLPTIKDLYQLGPIIDYRIPQALRFLGVLQYAPELKEKITKGVEIAEKSSEEIEIRLAAAHAVLEILKLINRNRILVRGPLVRMNQLDYYLWQLGRKCSCPPHLTLTTAY